MPTPATTVLWLIPVYLSENSPPSRLSRPHTPIPDPRSRNLSYIVHFSRPYALKNTVGGALHLSKDLPNLTLLRPALYRRPRKSPRISVFPFALARSAACSLRSGKPLGGGSPVRDKQPCHLGERLGAQTASTSYAGDGIGPPRLAPARTRPHRLLFHRCGPPPAIRRWVSGQSVWPRNRSRRSCGARTRSLGGPRT